MNFFEQLSIKAHSLMSLGFSLTLMVAIGALGLISIEKSEVVIQDLHLDMQHSFHVGEIFDHLGQTQVQLMLALQHDPGNKLSSMHRHPISLHLDQALANESHVEHARQSINNSDLDNQETKHTEPLTGPIVSC